MSLPRCIAGQTLTSSSLSLLVTMPPKPIEAGARARALLHSSILVVRLTEVRARRRWRPSSASYYTTTTTAAHRQSPTQLPPPPSLAAAAFAVVEDDRSGTEA